MNRIDQSLDDIIKGQRQEKKHSKAKTAHSGAAPAAAGGKAGRTGGRAGKQTSPANLKRAAGHAATAGIQSRGAAIRTEKSAKVAKSNSPYARPGAAGKKETALFTETYKAAKAPVTEIFTAGYIPKPTATLKLFTVNYRKTQGQSAGEGGAGESLGPLTTKSLRLVTTQQPIRRPASPTMQIPATSQKLTLTTHNKNARNNFSNSNSNSNNFRDDYNDDRIPTGPRNPGPSAPASTATAGGNRGGDFYRPGDRNARDYRNDRNDSRDVRNDRNDRNGSGNLRNTGGNDRRGGDSYNDSRPGAGHNTPQQLNSRSNNNSNNNVNNYNDQRRDSSPRASEQRSYQDNHHNSSTRQQQQQQQSAPTMDMNMDMDMDDGMVSIKGSAPGSSVTFRGESGPVTIEIENLDPGTTAEDVKYVCSRFGEIKSCICTNGFSQVTYARKAAGLAAIENLHGKKADNGKVLRVTMRRNVILHEDVGEAAAHVPSPIAGPMKLLTKAVQGTITNAGTLYSDQLLAAQQMLKVQQHRMAQLHREEQRITSLRMQSEPQLSNMNSLSSSGVNRGFF